jgi:predicted metal-dependent phosphoesterase TrpH
MSSEASRQTGERPDTRGEALLRADLHVHSYHSGYAGHMRFLRARDCYSEPEAVYQVAKARGMDLVTITDHDSIDGCLEFLDRHPGADDFFISEEIECRVPGLPLKVHIGAYDISERIHREVQPLRKSVYETAEYLRNQHVFFTLNHLFFFLHQQMTLDAYLRALLPLFSAFEVRNGTMLEAHNLLIEDIVADRRRTPSAAVAVGGSDAHTLAAVATTYTEAPGANRAEFLQSLRAGRTRVGGRHGSTRRVMREIYGVVGRYWASLVGVGRQELPWQHRAIGLAFSMVSMPAEFIPAIIALANKRSERRRIDRFREEWAAATDLARGEPFDARSEPVEDRAAQDMLVEPRAACGRPSTRPVSIERIILRPFDTLRVVPSPVEGRQAQDERESKSSVPTAVHDTEGAAL